MTQKFDSAPGSNGGKNSAQIIELEQARKKNLDELNEINGNLALRNDEMEQTLREIEALNQSKEGAKQPQTIDLSKAVEQKEAHRKAQEKNKNVIRREKEIAKTQEKRKGVEKLGAIEKKIKEIEAKIAKYIDTAGERAEPKIIESFQREMNNLVGDMVAVCKQYDIKISKNFVAKQFNIAPKAKTQKENSEVEKNATKKAHYEDRLARAAELNLSEAEINNLQRKLGIPETQPETPVVEQNKRAPAVRQQPRNPGRPAIDDSAEKAKEDYAKFLQVCEDRGTGSLVRQIEAMSPEFVNLSEGKKMMVIAGMNQEILKHVNQKATLEFQQKAGKVNGLGKFFGTNNRFGRFANVVGNMPTLLRKNFIMAKSRKDELEALKSDAHETEGIRNGFLQEKIPGLVEVYGKYNIDAFLGKDGKTPVVDFANLKSLRNASPATRESGKKYTELANEIAYTPKGSSTYKKLEKQLADARKDFLLDLEIHARANAVPNPEAYTHQYLSDSENLMKVMNLAAGNPQTAQALSNIANNPAYKQAIKDLVTERGAVMLGSAGARLGVRTGIMLAVGGTLATVTGPAAGVLILGTTATAGVISYFTGRVRANKTLEQQKELARNGMRQVGGVSKKTQKFLDELQVAEGKLKNPKNSAAENEIIIDQIKTLNTEIAKERQNGLSSTGFSSVEKNLKRLSDEKIEAILNETSPMKKQAMLLELKTATDFVMAKVERQEINYGKGRDVFVNQDKLVTALQKAQTAIQTNLNEAKIYEMFNAADADANITEMAREALAKRSRLKEYGGLRAERIKNEETAWKHSQATRSAFYGALLAGSTASTMELGYHMGWIGHQGEAVVANTQGTAKTAAEAGAGTAAWQLPNGNFDANKWLFGENNNNLGPVSNTVGHPSGVSSGIEHATHHVSHPHTAVHTPPKPVEHENMDGDDNSTIEEWKRLENAKIKIDQHPVEHSNDIVVKPAIPTLAQKGPVFDHVPSYKEVSDYKFTDSDRSVIKQMAEARMNGDMQKFFPDGKHQGLLYRNVNRFINRNEGGIWSDDKTNLHKFFTQYEEETGDTAKPGETTEDYLRHIEEYYSEKDFLSGKNLPKANPKDVYVSYNEKNQYTVTQPVRNPEPAVVSQPRPVPTRGAVEFQQPRPRIGNPRLEYRFDNNPESWHKNSLKTFLGGEDSRVWRRIHRLPANDFIQRTEGGFMGKNARMYREWLRDQASFYRVNVQENMSVEDLSRAIAEHRVFHEVGPDVPSTPRGVAQFDQPRPVSPQFTRIESQRARFETPISEPKKLEPVTIEAPVIKPELSDQAAAWYTKSWGEYFNGRLRPWSKIRDMNAQEFLKDESVRRKYTELHEDLKNIIHQEHVSVDDTMTVNDLMQKLATLNKNGETLHELVRENGGISPSELQLASTNHELSSVETEWANQVDTATGKTHGVEILGNYKYSEAVDLRMEKMITKLLSVGTDETFWEQMKTMKVSEFLSLDPDISNPSHDFLAETIFKMNKIDPDILKREDLTVERFMHAVYARDEYVKLIRVYAPNKLNS